MPSQVKYRLF